jgi:hypothetical protein
VPVWTSQLYESDWWQPVETPLAVTLTPDGGGWDVAVENHLNRPIAQSDFVFEGRIIGLGAINPNSTIHKRVARGEGQDLSNFVRNQSSGFAGAVQARQNAFGSTASGQITNLVSTTIAVSFLGEEGVVNNIQNPYGGVSGMNSGFYQRFISPPGMDLTAQVARGNAVVLAWAEDYSPIPPLNKFTVLSNRNHRNTLLRVTVPL